MAIIKCLKMNFLVCIDIQVTKYISRYNIDNLLLFVAGHGNLLFHPSLITFNRFSLFITTPGLLHFSLGWLMVFIILIVIVQLSSHLLLQSHYSPLRFVFKSFIRYNIIQLPLVFAFYTNCCLKYSFKV